MPPRKRANRPKPIPPATTQVIETEGLPDGDEPPSASLFPPEEPAEPEPKAEPEPEEKYTRVGGHVLTDRGWVPEPLLRTKKG